MDKRYSVHALLVLFAFCGFATAVETQPTIGWKKLTEIGWVVPDFQEFKADHPTSGAVRLKDGWDSFANKLMRPCVTGDQADLPAGSGRVLYYDVYTHEDLLRTLNVSASGSYGGVASGTATFAQRLTVAKDARNIVATAFKQTGGKGVLSNYQIESERLKALLDTKVPEAQRVANFRRECGDAFVKSQLEGVRLNAFFQYTFSDQELVTHLSASASGSYSGASGSASLDVGATTRVRNNKTSIDVNWLAKGGLPRPIDKGGDLLSLLNAFAVDTPPTKVSGITKVEPTFTDIVLHSYRDVPNWPPKLKLVGVSPWLIKVLMEHSRRLGYLSEHYSNAATTPSGFYTPFAAGEADLRLRARALNAAASCVRQVVDYCAINADCEPEEMLSAARLPNTCPGLVNAFAPNEQAEARQLLGIELAQGNARVLGTRAEAAAAYKIPFLYYYYAYAAAPLKRSVRRGAGTVAGRRNATDESRQIEITCDKDADAEGCKSIMYAALAMNAAKIKEKDMEAFANARAKAVDVYRRWVLLTRINPMADSACRETPQHPLCIDAAQREEIVRALQADFGAEHGFYLGGPPPAPKKLPPVPISKVCPKSMCV